MDKKTLFLAGAVLLSLTLASCSQKTDATLEQERSEVLSSQSVSDLTLQLKEYDSRFIYDNTDNLQPQTRLPKITYSKGDIVKIAISGIKDGSASADSRERREMRGFPQINLQMTCIVML